MIITPRDCAQGPTGKNFRHGHVVSMHALRAIHGRDTSLGLSSGISASMLPIQICPKIAKTYPLGTTWPDFDEFAWVFGLRSNLNRGKLQGKPPFSV